MRKLLFIFSVLQYVLFAGQVHGKYDDDRFVDPKIIRDFCEKYNDLYVKDKNWRIVGFLQIGNVGFFQDEKSDNHRDKTIIPGIVYREQILILRKHEGLGYWDIKVDKVPGYHYYGDFTPGRAIMCMKGK